MRKILPLLLAALAAIGGYTLWRGMRTPAAESSAYFTAADRMMVIDGATVRVRIEGPKDAPPVILLHGFIYSLETWDALAAALKDDYRVIRFDLLGHGLSGPDPEQRYSPDERAAFVGAVMDALGIKRAIIGGNSLGGLAAWRFAARSPERVSALILVAPGAYPLNGVSDQPLPPPPPMALFLKTAPAAGVDFALKNIYGDDSKVTPQKVALVSAMMRGNGDAFIQSIEEFTLPDPDPLLATIKAPTLILWGADDAVIPVEQGERLAAAIPGARLIVYERVGHVAHEEAPEKTAIDVTAFLTATRTGE